MIQEKALLANLTVRTWSARKRDRDVGKEIESKHQAQDAGNFNKLLIDKKAILPVVKLSGTLRDTHYKMTLPWGDNGDRLLPTKMYLEYTKVMRGLIGQFDGAVHAFCSKYPTYKTEARKRLGTMYDAQDYPDVSHIQRKFESKISFLPVPDAKDFRVDLNADEVEQIRKDLGEQIAIQQEQAMKDLWMRLKEVVEKIHDRLSDPEAVFRDSLIDNAVFACDISEKLNLNEDVAMDKVREDIRHRLCRVQPQRLREDKQLRAVVANSAREILGKFPA